MDKTKKELVDLMMLVSEGKVLKKNERLMLSLCLSELVAFSDDASVQDSVQIMLGIAAGE